MDYYLLSLGEHTQVRGRSVWHMMSEVKYVYFEKAVYNDMKSCLKDWLMK